MKKYLVLGLVLVGVLFVNSMTAFAVVSHVINASAGAGGTINPSGLVTVTHGSNKTFTITPNAGYIVSNVLVDSTSVGRANSYRFNNVISDQVISATFDSGWSAPSHFANNNSVIGPSYVYSSDNQYSVFNDQNDRIDYYGFGLSVPTSATVNGIELAFEANRPDPRTVSFSFSTDGGTTWTTGSGVKNSGIISSTDATYILGSASDLWNRTWTPADFSNLRVRVDAQTTNPGDVLNLDQIQVKVHYTTDTTAPSGGSVSYTDGYFNTLSVPVTYTLGTDTESGVNNASGKLERASATLSPSGSCGAFSSFSDLVTESTGSYTDTSVVTGYCYKYQYQISDNTGNVATYTSMNVVKTDTVSPVVTVNSAPSIDVDFGSTYSDYGATATDSVSSVGVDALRFVPLHQNNRGWTKLALALNGDVFATVLADNIYVKRNGADSFVSLNQPHLNWVAIAVSPVNGNVYASVFDGEGVGIYMQTGGTGDFVKLNSVGSIAGLTVAPNGNVYAAQVSGKIYMQTGGTGDFTAVSGVANKPWNNVAATSDGNVYATTYNKDYLYMQTGGTGDFIALNTIAQRTWTSVSVSSNGDVYATAYTNDNWNYYDSYIYKRTGGVGDFLPLEQGGKAWSSVASSLGSSDVYILYGSNSSYETTYADIYQLKMVTVYDSVEIPVSVASTVNTSVPGTYTVTYTATDSAGNTATATRTVVVRDTVAPVITLNGSNPITVQVNNSFTDPGVTITDNYDTGLTPVITGTVDTSTVGSYVLHYNATDSSGNSATEVTRTVNVIDQETPSTSDNVPASWTNADVIVTFSCTDNVACAKVYYTTDGTDPTTSSSFVDAASSWGFTVSTEGQYTVKYFGVDASDNAETIKTASNTLKIDKTLPKASMASPLTDTHLKGVATLSTSANDAGGSELSKVEFWYGNLGSSNTKIGDASLNPENGRYEIAWDTKTASDGVYSIWAIPFDNASNQSHSEYVPVVVDNTKPVITLLGSSVVDITMPGNYTDEGVTAADNIDGDLTSSVVKGGDVFNNTVAGTYVITYNVTDKAGNAANQVTRTITVHEASSGGSGSGSDGGSSGGGSSVPPPSGGGGGAHGVLPVGQVLGASTQIGAEISGCGMRTIGYSTVSGVSCEHNKPHSEGEVLGAEKFIFTQYMRRGLKGSEVPELQKRLTSEGFYSGPIDGKFGVLTDQAVRAYQKANPPLKIDGIVGVKTRAVLNK